MVNANLIQNKVVAVTGANRGIGLALVRQLLSQNNTVITTARQPADASSALQDLAAASGGRLHITQLDTGSTASIAAWALEVKKLTQHVDVVFNNAGVVHNGSASFLEATPDTMLQEFQVNALGPFFVVQQLHQQGLIGGQTHTLVAQISSVLGSIGDTVWVWVKGAYGYRASKAALNMLNKLMVQDLAGRNVELVVLHPGYVDTDMSDHKGTVQPADSASGMISVLQSGKPLNGKFFSYDGPEIEW